VPVTTSTLPEARIRTVAAALQAHAGRDLS
jgi:hypothetical protein